MSENSGEKAGPERIWSRPMPDGGAAMKQTILIAEDEADIRNILRLYLESENYEVLEAADGESAVAAVRSGSPGSGDPGHHEAQAWTALP